MKIAYINYIQNLDDLKGVHNKVTNQTQSIVKNSLPISVFILTYSNPPKNTNNITYIQIPKNYGYVKRAFFLTKYIKNHFASYSVVILRQAIYSPLFWFYFRKRSFKLISECHSKVFEELALAKLPFITLVQKLSYSICQTVIDAKISMTDEIAQYEKELGFKKPIKAISNGISIPVQPTGFKPFNGKTLDLIFVGSQLNPWHGLDRLLFSIEQYSGPVNFNIHIVGNISNDIQSNFNLKKHKLLFYGVLPLAKVTDLYPKVTIGISSLTFFRCNLNEACVLKTREYTANGLPFIYAYKDTDIKKPAPFCLSFPNQDSPIDMNTVIDFATSISDKQKEISAFAEQFAKEHMSWDTKMQQYTNFCTEITNPSL
jgi:hypothetical protein